MLFRRTIVDIDDDVVVVVAIVITVLN